ncbi:2-hydroxyacid dehydrogenase [Acidisphaera sp. L21]|uniref:2-hydroxyacid dehydrogenase n=1 Tax=Acidisphaera sp. L21 TaxID=1641851 RepID=UPI00131BC829|nr:2-hydroxyacid dehydrogenase [Acidisphaera sp. L21]
MSSTAPVILVLIDLNPVSLAKLESHYSIIQGRTREDCLAVAADHAGSIRAVLTNGTTGLTGEVMAAFPNLSIVMAQGVGFEGIDVPAARARGITVTHGPGTNGESVADHTMALMLAAMRDIPVSDAAVRAGKWRSGSTMRPIASGKRVGILGLGDIGGRIAKRCEAFNMSVAYHNRRKLPDVGWTYVASTLELAEWSDVLICVLPGGAATRHLIGKAEMDALGKDGFLVNVGRGSVVDTDALISALSEHRLGGAALDVIDGEPKVPDALCKLPNVVLTPHMAGRSPESVAATIGLVIENLAAHFGGQPVLTPVPA